jgi:hypothetical protein
VLDGEAQLGLGALVVGGRRLAAGKVERDLCLFRKLFGKVLEQLRVSG